MIEEAPTVRRRWPRLVLTLSPDLDAGLRALAVAHYRDGKREALRILTEGVERELTLKGER